MRFNDRDAILYCLSIR